MSLAGLAAAAIGDSGVAAAQPGPAYFVRSLDDPSERDEARPDVLDTPVLPGSVIKVVTLVAAIESQTIEPETTRMCRRTVTVDGRRYVCSHPDLKRPLSPAEALAHSCNDFFVSLAPRLPRAAVNSVRARLGLPPVASAANFGAALVGLDGPRITPRALLDVVSRLAGADPHRPVEVSAAARRVLRDGLRGAAEYGTAQALADRKIVALAKTGTAPMLGGAWMGLVVALDPLPMPTRGIVVVAPGAAGLDAAALAADLLGRRPIARPTASAASRPREQLPVPARPPAIRLGVTTANGSARVTQVDLEDYIARVVAAEGEASAPAAAQQALAITARTFALANRQRHRREGYDLCDTTHCQVVRAATAASRDAALATSGRVLVNQGQPASVFYSASCGGHSELASAVWPGAVDSAATSQRDEACGGEPNWTSDVRSDELERALRAGGHRGDRLRDLRVIARNASGRVARLRVDGFTPREITGHDFRMAVGRVAGWQRIKSTAFDLRRTGGGYRFAGRGFGHGVGLCVIGAGRRAAGGRNADEILRFYFPNLRIDSYHTPALLTRAPASPSASRPAPSDVRSDVLLALPAGEETERGAVVHLVRAARDQIAARAAVPRPPSIRVTVHPTVEAFGRATGQPWWVSAATDGSNIDLLPVSILRQRAQLERTIRHEVAHVLLDQVLSSRPLWVREGAASYFAAAGSMADNSSQTSIASGRTPCPADLEFLRPLSAGAHRAAYAQAEACFRRAVAAGRRWQDVR